MSQRERRAVSPDTALRLARYLGGDPASWMKLQAAYDLRRTEEKAGARIRQDIRPRDSSHP